VISYRELLEVFWYSHNPTVMPWSEQYKSIIFYHNDAQKALAEETKAALETRLARKVYTEIVPAGAFYLAEDYHQKYYLRQVPQLEAEFLLKYPDINDFVNSTAAARVNGYLGGFGTTEDLDKELASLGLSPESQELIRALAKQGLTSACPVSPTT
jgi:peptide-methionine (S)-S-oxide reductase